MKGVILNVVLHGQNNREYLLKFLILLILISFSGFCKKEKKIIPDLPDATNESVYAQKWQKYGAYYDKFETVLKSFYSMQSTSSRIKIYKKIKILTTDGAEYGTIPVYRYAQRISRFEPMLFDQDGKEIELDGKKLRKTYTESGKVVFPNVKAGYTVELTIEFLHQNTYYSGFRERFSFDIPLRVGRFVHITTSNCEYDYKTYGNRYKLKEEIYKKGRVRVWSAKDLEPKKDLDYLDYFSNTEPMVIARLLKVKSWSKSFNSEKKVFREYKNEIAGITFNLKDESYQKIRKECLKKIANKTPMERAKWILKWVQDNMALSGEEHDYFSEITETQQASELQIACLCNKLFKDAGLNSHVVITGHKNWRPIDPSFLVHSNYITDPMPVVFLDNKKYAVFPIFRGYELGEYPLSYNNVLCLNISKKAIEPLPPPKWGSIWIRKRRILDLSSIPGKYSMVYEYKQNSASVYRRKFLKKDKAAQKGYFENLIKDYSETNRLKSFKIKNLRNYDKPLTAIIHFENNDTPIPYENKKIFKLNNFFLDYFEDITLDRTEDVFIKNPAIYIDEIEVLKIPGKKIEFDIKMEKPKKDSKVEVIHYAPSKNEYTGNSYSKISSSLFTVDYKKKETDSSYIFQRTLNLKPVHIKKEEIKKIYDDCVKLNSIKNSSIIIH